jgi:hypothetical protein
MKRCRPKPKPRTSAISAATRTTYSASFNAKVLARAEANIDPLHQVLFSLLAQSTLNATSWRGKIILRRRGKSPPTIRTGSAPPIADRTKWLSS